MADVSREMEEAANPQQQSETKLETELASLQQTQERKDYQNEIFTLKLNYAKDLEHLNREHESTVKTLIDEHKCKTDQLKKDRREKQSKLTQLGQDNLKNSMEFDERMEDEKKKHSEHNKTNEEIITELGGQITEKQVLSDERLKNLEKSLAAKLANAFGGDCRQINELTSDKNELQKKLEEARCGIQTREAQLAVAKNKKDNYVKLLVDRHEEVVSNKNIEIENLKSSYQDDLSALKAAHEAAKQELKDEYANYKRNYEESRKGQQEDTLNQKDEEIRGLQEKIRDMVQRHQQELSDKEAELEGLRFSDGEKIAELEASTKQLQQDLEKKDQDHRIHIRDLLLQHINAESELREKKKEVEEKKDVLETKLDKMSNEAFTRLQ